MRIVLYRLHRAVVVVYISRYYVNIFVLNSDLSIIKQK